MKKEVEIILESDGVKIEDGGMAHYIDVDLDKGFNGMFARIHSWDEKGKHVDFTKFLNKKVRLTIEVIE